MQGIENVASAYKFCLIWVSIAEVIKKMVRWVKTEKLQKFHKNPYAKPKIQLSSAVTLIGITQ